MLQLFLVLLYDALCVCLLCALCVCKCMYLLICNENTEKVKMQLTWKCHLNDGTRSKSSQILFYVKYLKYKICCAMMTAWIAFYNRRVKYFPHFKMRTATLRQRYKVLLKYYCNLEMVKKGARNCLEKIIGI